MSTLKTLLVLTTGCALGIGLVLACGDDDDDGVADVDAAEVCDCPAAEPPLAGRIVRFTNSSTNEEGSVSTGTSAGCLDTGYTLLSGSCTTNNGDDQNVVLRYAGPGSGLPPDSNDNRTWGCEWDNPTGQVKTFHATVICLAPAGQ